MLFRNLRCFFRKDLSEYIPKLLQKDKKISQLIKKIKTNYSKKEIVDYFRSFEGNNFIFLTEENDLFLHGERLNSFDDWLIMALNLMIFSNAQEAYDNFIIKTSKREDQLSHAKELKKEKKLSMEQYLYLVEIINCRTDIKTGKI